MGKYHGCFRRSQKEWRSVPGYPERVEGKASAQQTALGNVPDYRDLDWSGANFSEDTFKTITSVNRSQWQQELTLHDELLTKLEYHLPAALKARYGALQATLAA